MTPLGEWWRPATILQRIVMLIALVSTFAIAIGLLLPWATVLIKGPPPPPPGPVEPVEANDSSPIRNVQILFLSAPNDALALQVDRFMTNTTFRHIKLSWAFVDGPTGVSHGVAIRNKYEQAIGKNGKAGKVQWDIQMTVKLWEAIDTFLDGDAEFLFVSTTDVILSPSNFYKIFRNETRPMVGACACMKNFGRFVLEAGWVFSREGATKAKTVPRENVLSQIDWRFDVVVANWVAQHLGGNVKDYSSAQLASELPDSDVRLMATDLEFLIPQCAGPEAMHCGACGLTGAQLRDVGAWPRGDGPAMGEPKLQKVFDKIRYSTDVFRVETISAGKSQLCMKKPPKA